jgi:hypothetical protein
MKRGMQSARGSGIIYGICEETIRNQIRDEHLESIKIGGTVRVSGSTNSFKAILSPIVPVPPIFHRDRRSPVMDSVNSPAEPACLIAFAASVILRSEAPPMF